MIRSPKTPAARWVTRLLAPTLLLCACTSGHSDRPTDSDSGTQTDSETETDTDTETETETETETAPTTFVDVAERAGFVHSQWRAPADWRPSCNGVQTHTGGASAGDYDNDGFVDVFLAVIDGPDRLYHNRGDGTFDEVGAEAGVDHGGDPSGTAWADLDGDGLLDLLVSYYHGDFVRLYRNLGDGTFEESAVERGLVAPDERSLSCGMNWSISVADPDLDGDLDVFVASWNINLIGRPTLSSRYFVNTGRGHFIDRTEARGLVAAQPPTDDDRLVYSMAFTPSFGDLNGDGWPDLALASDFNSNTIFYNDGDGTFTEDSTGVRDVQNAMGGVLADVDDDGDLDWWISAIWDDRDPLEFPSWGHSGNRLYLNDGTGGFSDVAASLGLHDGGWGWGVAALDVQNDGRTDLMLTNGHIMTGGAAYLAEPFEDDPSRLWSRAPDGTYLDIGVESGVTDTGQGRSLLTLDIENDGDLDVFIAQLQDRPILYQNNLPQGHWLRVELRDIGKNTRCIGAVVRIQAKEGGPWRMAQVHGNSTYLGTSPALAHFGLGSHDEPVYRLSVQWPTATGEPQILRDVAIDRVLRIDRRR